MFKWPITLRGESQTAGGRSDGTLPVPSQPCFYGLYSILEIILELPIGIGIDLKDVVIILWLGASVVIPERRGLYKGISSSEQM